MEKQSHIGPQPFKMLTILSLRLCFCKVVYSPFIAGDTRLNYLLFKAPENPVL